MPRARDGSSQHAARRLTRAAPVGLVARWLVGRRSALAGCSRSPR